MQIVSKSNNYFNEKINLWITCKNKMPYKQNITMRKKIKYCR